MMTVPPPRRAPRWTTPPDVPSGGRVELAPCPLLELELELDGVRETVCEPPERDTLSPELELPLDDGRVDRAESLGGLADASWGASVAISTAAASTSDPVDRFTFMARLLSFLR